MLKAGVINKKQKKQADHKLRQQNKAQAKKNKKKKKAKVLVADNGPVAPSVEQLQQVRQEHLDKLAKIIEDGQISDLRSGRRRFYFIDKNGSIPFVTVSDILGRKLEQGEAAIVDDPKENSAEHHIVNKDAALKILNHDKTQIRFFQN